MPQFIDRRLNPRDKSLGNRMRFLKRTRARIKEAVDKAVRERTIGDAAKGGSVSIPVRRHQRADVPRLRHGRRPQRVLPGNKEFVSGDRIDKPKGGQGGRGRQGSQGRRRRGAFSFALTEEEFLDLLFEDLELPDLIKSSLKDAKLAEPRRAGYSADGMIPNLNVLRTMRQSHQPPAGVAPAEPARGREAGKPARRDRRTAGDRGVEGGGAALRDS